MRVYILRYAVCWGCRGTRVVMEKKTGRTQTAVSEPHRTISWRFGLKKSLPIELMRFLPGIW